MSETRILIRLLWIYFAQISEFGSASEFRGGCEPPKPPLRYATGNKVRVSELIFNPESEEVLEGTECIVTPTYRVNRPEGPSVP
jgi:hypothetical protein